MEQTIWLYFSIVAILLTLGIVMSLIETHRGRVNAQEVQNALRDLKAQCNFVCAQAPGTNLPVAVRLPSELFLYARDDRICVWFSERTRCQKCDCVLDPYTLDLNTTLHTELFATHDFNCYFARTAHGVDMDCKG